MYNQICEVFRDVIALLTFQHSYPVDDKSRHRDSSRRPFSDDETVWRHSKPR